MQVSAAHDERLSQRRSPVRRLARAGEAAYRQTAWRRLSREVVARDGACVRCRSPRPHLQAHHVDPRHDGGIDAASNLITLCARLPRTRAALAAVRPLMLSLLPLRSDDRT
jgi:HNH endonuclease